MVGALIIKKKGNGGVGDLLLILAFTAEQCVSFGRNTVEMGRKGDVPGSFQHLMAIKSKSKKYLFTKYGAGR